jgi:hypothetical protein
MAISNSGLFFAAVQVSYINIDLDHAGLDIGRHFL